MTALRRVITARQLHQKGAATTGGAGAAAELLGSLSLQDSAAEPPHNQQRPAEGAAAEASSIGVGAVVPPAHGGDWIGGANRGVDTALAVTQGDMQAARGRVRPSGLREVALELPATRWRDVGGLHDVKQQLQVPGWDV